VPTTQWHKDEVFELPAAAVLLASSDACRNQIYRIGELTYGLQFHPEVDTDIIKSWEENGDEAFRLFGGQSVSEAVALAQSQLLATWEMRIKKWGQAVATARPH
jgi:GMP synthase-like glutamine amidotransferase